MRKRASFITSDYKDFYTSCYKGYKGGQMWQCLFVLWPQSPCKNRGELHTKAAGKMATEGHRLGRLSRKARCELFTNARAVRADMVSRHRLQKLESTNSASGAGLHPAPCARHHLLRHPSAAQHVTLQVHCCAAAAKEGGHSRTSPVTGLAPIARLYNRKPYTSKPASKSNKRGTAATFSHSQH